MLGLVTGVMLLLVVGVELGASRCRCGLEVGTLTSALAVGIVLLLWGVEFSSLLLSVLIELVIRDDVVLLSSQKLLQTMVPDTARIKHPMKQLTSNWNLGILFRF